MRDTGIVMRSAVVLFNLGGPDGIASVEPFLFRLFADPAIIRLPALLRLPLAWAIARRRGPEAREIYRRLGGRSPIHVNTAAQAAALRERLGGEAEVFVAMRYWGTTATETARRVREWGAERVLLCPLYPQFSTTTTASSWLSWRQAAAAAGLTAPGELICCWPRLDGFIATMAAGIAAALDGGDAGSRWRVLYSAHGLPEKIAAGGDPYRWQVEETVRAIRARLRRPEIEDIVCYQSRVGPLRWLGPSTEAEIRRAGTDGRSVILVPVSFVSEHSETLYELDMLYAEIARTAGVGRLVRVPTCGKAPAFIASLAAMIRERLRNGAGVGCGDPGPRCPGACSRCPMLGRGEEV